MSDSDASVAASGRDLVARLAGGRFDDVAASFDEKMCAALPRDRLAAAWASVVTSAGAFEEVQNVEVAAVGPYQKATVTCRFARARMDVEAVLDARGRVAGLFFKPTPDRYAAPDYVDPTTFVEREVTVGVEGWPLPGTLTLPLGAGPFPAVVLVHGSGPNDRDETVGANKPFRDLAGGLASRGIASLRYDKRTKVHGARMVQLPDLTVDQETIDDAVSAVALVRALPEVDPARVVVTGHSLGGQLAPRIAARSTAVSAIAILAGSTRGVPEMMVEQIRYIASLDPAKAPLLEPHLSAVLAAKARIEALCAGEPAREGESLLGAGAAYWRDIAAYDAVAVAATLGRPIFVAQGGRDYQVTRVDFERWQQALAGRPAVTCKLYPALNHLFGAGDGPSSPAEYQRRTPVASELISDLAEWVLALGAD